MQNGPHQEKKRTSYIYIYIYVIAVVESNSKIGLLRVWIDSSARIGWHLVLLSPPGFLNSESFSKSGGNDISDNLDKSTTM